MACPGSVFSNSGLRPLTISGVCEPGAFGESEKNASCIYSVFVIIQWKERAHIFIISGPIGLPYNLESSHNILIHFKLQI